MNPPVLFLRRIARIEGVSFLILLFIAMPLKYGLGQPLAVRWVGWAHGVLFLLFCLALLRAFLAVRPPWWQAAWIFASGLLPGGPWLADRTLTGWETRREDKL